MALNPNRFITERAALPADFSTYLKLLPKELRTILARYYYGPLEIKPIIDEVLDNGDFLLILIINIFSPDGVQLMNTVSLQLSPQAFLRDRTKASYAYNHERITFFIENKPIPYIRITVHYGGEHENYLVDIFLNSYYTALFYDKLETIIRILNKIDPSTIDNRTQQIFAGKSF